jgi:hypothetical protein
MRTEPNRGRRRALVLSALPITGAWVSAALVLPFADRRLLEAMAHELGMREPAFEQLAQRVRLNVDPGQITTPVREAMQRLLTVVGAAVNTAKASVPALIEDDFRSGRTLHVRGVVFSHIELALLLVVSDSLG